MGMREVRKSDHRPLLRASQILWQTGHPGIASAIEEILENDGVDPVELAKQVSLAKHRETVDARLGR